VRVTPSRAPRTLALLHQLLATHLHSLTLSLMPPFTPDPTVRRVFTRKAPESEKKLELPQLLVEGTLTLSNGDELEGLLHHRDVPDAESPRVV
jgi:hypothetical protein